MYGVFPALCSHAVSVMFVIQRHKLRLYIRHFCGVTRMSEDEKLLDIARRTLESGRDELYSELDAMVLALRKTRY